MVHYQLLIGLSLQVQFSGWWGQPYPDDTGGIYLLAFSVEFLLVYRMRCSNCSFLWVLSFDLIIPMWINWDDNNHRISVPELGFEILQDYLLSLWERMCHFVIVLLAFFYMITKFISTSFVLYCHSEGWPVVSWNCILYGIFKEFLSLWDNPSLDNNVYNTVPLRLKLMLVSKALASVSYSFQINWIKFLNIWKMFVWVSTRETFSLSI